MRRPASSLRPALTGPSIANPHLDAALLENIEIILAQQGSHVAPDCTALRLGAG